MSSLTYHEKELVGKLLAGVFALVAFALLAARSLAKPHLLYLEFMLAWTIIFLIPGFHFIYMQYFATDHRSDERDRDIRIRSSRSSYQVLLGGIFVFALFCELGWLSGMGPILAYIYTLSLLAHTAGSLRQLELHRTQDGYLGDYFKRRFMRRIQRREEGGLDQ